MRIISYNAALHFPGYGDMVRADKIREHLLEGDWDVVFLMEVYQKSLRKVLLDDKRISERYPFRIYNLQDYGRVNFYTFDNGLVILSKHIILEYDRYEYSNTLNTTLNRLLPRKDVLFANILYKEKSMGFFLTHLQWGNNTVQKNFRYKQMNELKLFIEQKWGFENLVIVGDLNIFGDTTDDDYQMFTNIFPNMIDCYLTTNEDAGYTWHVDNTRVVIPFTNQRFDYIFTSRDINAVSSSITKFSSALHFQDVDWQPTVEFNIYEKIYFRFAWIFRILLSPIILINYLISNLIRLIRKRKFMFIGTKRDLSDHYGLDVVLHLE